MSRTKAKAGVIGLGRQGLRHVKAYGLLQGAEVVAVCDTNPDQLSVANAQIPGVRGYTDWRLLLDQEQLDVLSVVTNGPSHAAITIDAAAKCVARILCEKPIANSVGDALAMVDACKVSGTRLSINLARRWVSSYSRLRDKISSGLIGKPCHMWVTCGGGLFAAVGSHFVDLMRMLSGGNPVSVVGFVDKTGTPNPRGTEFKDPGVMVVYHFDNGMRGVVDMYEDLGVPPRIEIVGSIGRVMIDEMSGHCEVLARLDEDRCRPSQHYWLPLSPVPFEYSNLELVDTLVRSLEELLGEGDISCTGEDGLFSLEMLVGAHVSGKDGGLPVQLPLHECYHGLDFLFT